MLVLVLPLAAGTVTLLWAARGNAGATDPHVFNEGLTSTLTGQI